MDETTESKRKIKEAMNGLDLRCVIRELQFLKGGRIDAIYQNEDELRIRFYVPKFGNYEIFINPKRIHLTKYKRSMPMLPSNFAMLLRKHMIGKHVEEIEQHRMDRVIEISTDEKILIIEMFHKGNVILCDNSLNIIMPLYFQRWKDRVVVAKEKYRWPASLDVEDFTTFKRCFQDDKPASKVLMAMGFGEYSNEIFKRAGVKDRTASTMKKDEIEKLFDVAEDILQYQGIDASIVYEDGEPIGVIPFELKIASPDEYTLEKYDSLNKALDTYFNVKRPELTTPPKPAKEEEKKAEMAPEDKLEKEKRIMEQQKEAIEGYKEEEDEERKEASLIYNNFGLVDNVLTTLRNARAKYDWDEIKEIISKDESAEARAIIEIRESENKVIMNLDGNKLELFINKTPEENASYYFEHAKKMHRKAGGAAIEVEKRKEDMKKLEEEISPIFKPTVAEEEAEDKSEIAESEEEGEEITEEEPEIQGKKKGRWYHKYRYFWSIDGLLVVAGKDANTNEELIKKHTEPDDIVLHADIQGAPFTIIKQRRDKRERSEELTPQGIVEAAEFAASYSKAWQMGLGSVEVYWVRPEQVTKQAEPGQFLPKGAFMIRGERNYMKSIKLRLAVGADVQNQLFIVAPLKSVAAVCDYYVTIQPGETPAHEVAQSVKNKLIEKALYPDEKEIIESVPLEQIESRIPSAKASIMDKVESGIL